MINAKPVDTPMDPSVKLVTNQRETYFDLGRCKRLVGKQNYLTMTRPIAFAMSVVNQSLNSPCQEHWDAVVWILKSIKKAPRKGIIYQDKANTQIVGYSHAN